MSYFDSKKSKNLSDKKTTKYSLYGGNYEFQKQAINETKCQTKKPKILTVGRKHPIPKIGYKRDKMSYFDSKKSENLLDKKKF